jgi:pyruvate,water dikinase
MFVAAAAVVTDVGGVLSHATIVARELGIPAVVDTKVGTVELSDGDLVEVDGGAGVVRVLKRGS